MPFITLPLTGRGEEGSYIATKDRILADLVNLVEEEANRDAEERIAQITQMYEERLTVAKGKLERACMLNDALKRELNTRFGGSRSGGYDGVGLAARSTSPALDQRARRSGAVMRQQLRLQQEAEPKAADGTMPAAAAAATTTSRPDAEVTAKWRVAELVDKQARAVSAASGVGYDIVTSPQRQRQPLSPSDSVWDLLDDLESGAPLEAAGDTTPAQQQRFSQVKVSRPSEEAAPVWHVSGERVGVVPSRQSTLEQSSGEQQHAASRVPLSTRVVLEQEGRAEQTVRLARERAKEEAAAMSSITAEASWERAFDQGLAAGGSSTTPPRSSHASPPGTFGDESASSSPVLLESARFDETLEREWDEHFAQSSSRASSVRLQSESEWDEQFTSPPPQAQQRLWSDGNDGADGAAQFPARAPTVRINRHGSIAINRRDVQPKDK